jgi:hypothetical protein
MESEDARPGEFKKLLPGIVIMLMFVPIVKRDGIGVGSSGRALEHLRESLVRGTNNVRERPQA